MPFAKSMARWLALETSARRESQAAARALVALDDAEGLIKAATRAPWMALTTNEGRHAQAMGGGSKEDSWEAVPVMRLLWNASPECCEAFGRGLGDARWAWELNPSGTETAAWGEVSTLIGELVRKAAELEGPSTRHKNLASNVCALARGMELNPLLGSSAAQSTEVQFLDKAQAQWLSFGDDGCSAHQWARAWSSLMADPNRKRSYYREELEESFGAQWSSLFSGLTGAGSLRANAPEPDEIRANAQRLKQPALVIRKAWEEVQALGLARAFAREGEEEPRMWGARAGALALKEQFERSGGQWGAKNAISEGSREALWDALGALCPKDVIEALSELGLEELANQACLERLVLGQMTVRGGPSLRVPSL